MGWDKLSGTPLLRLFKGPLPSLLEGLRQVSSFYFVPPSAEPCVRKPGEGGAPLEVFYYRYPGLVALKPFTKRYRVFFLTPPPPKISKCRLVSNFFQKKLKYPDCPPLKSLSVGLPPPLPLKFLSVKSLLTGADT